MSALEWEAHLKCAQIHEPETPPKLCEIYAPIFGLKNQTTVLLCEV